MNARSNSGVTDWFSGSPGCESTLSGNSIGLASERITYPFTIILHRQTVGEVKLAGSFLTMLQAAVMKAMNIQGC